MKKFFVCVASSVSKFPIKGKIRNLWQFLLQLKKTMLKSCTVLNFTADFEFIVLIRKLNSITHVYTWF